MIPSFNWLAPAMSWIVMIVIVYMFVRVLWRGLNKFGKVPLPSISNLKVPTLQKNKEQFLFYTQDPVNVSIGMELDGNRVTRISEVEPQILVEGRKERTWEIWGKPIT